MGIIIDAHLHVVPCFCGMRNEMFIHGERYGKLRRGRLGKWRRSAKRGPYRFMPPSFESSTVSPEVALEYMDWVGVEKAVLLQAPMYGDHNEYLSELVCKYPDRFVAFAIVDPREGNLAVEKLEFAAKELGLVGIKLEPPDTPFYLDDTRYEAYWNKVAELNLLVGVDLGWDPPENPYSFQLDRLERVVQKYPNLTFIVLHLGVSELWDLKQDYPFPVLQKTLELKRYPNVWFELSGLQEFAEEEEYPYPRAQKIVEVAVEKVGAERLIWGTDFPGILIFCTYEQCLNLIRNHCNFLSTREKELILGENALKVYRFKE